MYPVLGCKYDSFSNIETSVCKQGLAFLLTNSVYQNDDQYLLIANQRPPTKKSEKDNFIKEAERAILGVHYENEPGYPCWNGTCDFGKPFCVFQTSGDGRVWKEQDTRCTIKKENDIYNIRME